MNYGYARCSTNETKQDINRQVRELKEAGANEIFLEYEHGDSKIKDQQRTMFETAREGDTMAAFLHQFRHCLAPDFFLIGMLK